jgi:hypothetical protein
MAEYSKIAEGSFTGTAATAHFISLGFKPKQFEMWNTTEWGSANATSQVQYALGFDVDAVGTAYVSRNASGNNDIENAKITTGGFRFTDGNLPDLGPVVTGSGGTAVDRANPTQVNITGHGFVTGDSVFIYGTTGMLQIAGNYYTVTRVNDNQFTINVDSSGFAANGTAVSARLWYPVNFPNINVPYYEVITGITRGATTTVNCAYAHAYVVGQEVTFVIPSQWGIVELDGLKGYVTSITASAFVVDINSSSFTAFSYPTSGTASLGLTFPQVLPVGDSNTGYSGPTVPFPATIPGAFAVKNTPGVIIGPSLITNVSGGGAAIRWRAEYPDQIVTEA